jgi:hypothetical protein
MLFEQKGLKSQQEVQHAPRWSSHHKVSFSCTCAKKEQQSKVPSKLSNAETIVMTNQRHQ